MGKQKKPSFGILFWIALLCFIVVLYIGSRVQFPAWIAQRFGGDYRHGLPSPPEPSTPTEPAIPTPKETTEIPEAPSAGTEADQPAETVSPPPPPDSRPPSTEDSRTGEATGSVSPPSRSRVSRLYFVRVSEAGTPELIPVERRIPSSQTPLTDTLKELLKGPSSTEKRAGISSLIPPGTKIRSIRIKDGIAIIDLDESFRFNPFGAEGFRSQVRQIVYTVTEFPGIQGVQFLVKGEKLDYLSAEGVYIGKPLDRASLER
ncbi:MAG: hypothetical protein Kow009_02840 [Spirochaetales bacterium]